jgi:hypothetical protein
MRSWNNRYLTWLVPALLLVLFITILLMAPLEKTLGETIRLVYAHAAFTRAGMLGIYASGLLGLLVATTANERLQSWSQTVAWVSFALFVIGGIFSIFAQRASWGGVALAEPRMRTSLTVTAVIVIVLLLNSWIPWIRLRGLLYTALALYIAWAIPNTPLILHPQNAVGTSPSLWIRLTFPALTTLALLMGLWFVTFIKRPATL